MATARHIKLNNYLTDMLQGIEMSQGAGGHKKTGGDASPFSK